MKKHTKFILPLLSLLILVFITSCSANKSEVRDDVPLSDLEAAIDTHLDKDSFAAMEESYLKGAMKLDTSLYESYIVKVNAYGANIDEYGIFKAKDSTRLKAAQDAVIGYLQMREDTWMDEYMPEEKPKLEAAEVKTTGLYVMYAILSDESRSDVFSEFENILVIN